MNSGGRTMALAGAVLSAFAVLGAVMVVVPDRLSMPVAGLPLGMVLALAVLLVAFAVVVLAAGDETGG
jgi:hypothetical protein